HGLRAVSISRDAALFHVASELAFILGAWLARRRGPRGGLPARPGARSHSHILELLIGLARPLRTERQPRTQPRPRQSVAAPPRFPRRAPWSAGRVCVEAAAQPSEAVGASASALACVRQAQVDRVRVHVEWHRRADCHRSGTGTLYGNRCVWLGPR